MARWLPVLLTVLVLAVAWLAYSWFRGHRTEGFEDAEAPDDFYDLGPEEEGDEEIAEDQPPQPKDLRAAFLSAAAVRRLFVPAQPAPRPLGGPIRLLLDSAGSRELRAFLNQQQPLEATARSGGAVPPQSPDVRGGLREAYAAAAIDWTDADRARVLAALQDVPGSEQLRWRLAKLAPSMEFGQSFTLGGVVFLSGGLFPPATTPMGAVPGGQPTGSGGQPEGQGGQPTASGGRANAPGGRPTGPGGQPAGPSGHQTGVGAPGAEEETCEEFADGQAANGPDPEDDDDDPVLAALLSALAVMLVQSDPDRYDKTFQEMMGWTRAKVVVPPAVRASVVTHPEVTDVDWVLSVGGRVVWPARTWEPDTQPQKGGVLRYVAYDAAPTGDGSYMLTGELRPLADLADPEDDNPPDPADSWNPMRMVAAEPMAVLRAQ